jgi:hypothetical protein
MGFTNPAAIRVTVDLGTVFTEVSALATWSNFPAGGFRELYVSKIGNSCQVSGYTKLGGAITGTATITLPTTAAGAPFDLTAAARGAGAGANPGHTGPARFVDVTARHWPAACYITANGRQIFFPQPKDDGGTGLVTPGSPFTWAVNDELEFAIFYRLANP